MLIPSANGLHYYAPHDRTPAKACVEVELCIYGGTAAGVIAAVQAAGFPPYPISYRCLTPPRGQCTNLLVAVCVSASHIAYGSLRMEPVFMALGQPAATAAALSLSEKCSGQDVPYAGLRERLLCDGQVLQLSGEAARPNAIV